MRHCWSDLEMFPKSAPGEIWEGSGQHFGLGTFLSQKMIPEKHDFVEEYFFGEDLGESLLPK